MWVRWRLNAGPAAEQLLAASTHTYIPFTAAAVHMDNKTAVRVYEVEAEQHPNPVTPYLYMQSTKYLILYILFCTLYFILRSIICTIYTRIVISSYRHQSSAATHNLEKNNREETSLAPSLQLLGYTRLSHLEV